MPGAAALVVGQTWSIDRKISDLLAQLRQARRGPPRQGGTGTVPFAPFDGRIAIGARRRDVPRPASRRYSAALARRISLDSGRRIADRGRRRLRQRWYRFCASPRRCRWRRCATPPGLSSCARRRARRTVLKLLTLECGYVDGAATACSGCCRRKRKATACWSRSTTCAT